MREIEKLEDLLQEAGIPFELRWFRNGKQIIYPNKRDWVCDAVCHSFSYGFELGLIEIMGLTKDGEETDDVIGYLTAEDVFEIICKHYSKHKGDWKAFADCE